MNAHTQIGHNGPPDPIDEALAPFADAISEAENWLDGEAVTTKEQMDAVDVVLKDIRKAGTEAGKAEKACVAPLHDAWKSEKARWKPTLDDLAAMKTGLAALVNGFKQKLAAEQEAKRLAAEQEAQRLADDAAAKLATANAGNIDEQREAHAAQEDAAAAAKIAKSVAGKTVKGMRTVTNHSIEDMRAAVNWIATNDKAAMADFAAEYVRRNHKTTQIAGVKVWQEKEAY